jgi:uncharacterized membrane protein YheB (UPF0754 family)
MELKFILPPLLGAVIGWLTNFVAIKLLFRPHNPISFMGLSVQGLIPKRRSQIARSMADTIESELLSSQDFAAILDSVDWKGEVEQVIEELVEHKLSSERISKVPIIGFVSDNLKTQIKYLITKEILSQIEKKKAGFKEKLQNSIDVRGVVTERIDNLDLIKFEGLLQKFISKELRHLEWLGGLMGFIIGIVQSVIFIIFS